MKLYIVEDPAVWASILFISLVAFFYYILYKRDLKSEHTQILNDSLIED